MNSEYKSAVHRVLGDAFEILPSGLQERHNHGGQLCLSGRADVVLGKGPLPSFACWIAGMPRNGMGQPVTIMFTSDGSGLERWQRDFDGRRHHSIMRPGDGVWSGCLIEQMGVMKIVFALSAQPDRLVLRMVKFAVFGLQLPSCLSPRCTAFEAYTGRGFEFDIVIDMPIVGRMIHYRGCLTPQSIQPSSRMVS